MTSPEECALGWLGRGWGKKPSDDKPDTTNPSPSCQNSQTQTSERLISRRLLHEIYTDIPPEQVELVLQGCNGDLVKAIEHFLSANDAMFLPRPPVYGFSALDLPFTTPRPAPRMTIGSIKSAFTPLNDKPRPAHGQTSDQTSNGGQTPDWPIFGSLPRLSENSSSLYVPYTTLAQTSHLLLQPCPAGCLQCRRTFSLAPAENQEDQRTAEETCGRPQEAVDLSDRSWQTGSPSG
ncbi:hypothetical protein JTE90_024378 [Oedothorax gibbosus]|uniref:DMA domain-containing protein n=1 Tax=Oedothorax gibbosus TaxID=931172 RepID=A0AAV6U4X1_9ARAC|nr:hypothetical protein JTE90_024378 [Oedothorax gibbosus]